MVIGFEIDEEGYIERIVIFVDDKETAIHLSNVVNELDKDVDNCQYGVLCHAKEARIIVHEEQSSGGVRLNKGVYHMIMMILSIMVVFHM